MSKIEPAQDFTSADLMSAESGGLENAAFNIVEEYKNSAPWDDCPVGAECGLR